MGHTAASVGTFTFLQAGPWWRPQGLPWPRSPATGHADLQGPQGQRGTTLEPGVLLEFQAHRHYPTQPERRQGQSKEGESVEKLHGPQTAEHGRLCHRLTRNPRRHKAVVPDALPDADLESACYLVQ